MLGRIGYRWLGVTFVLAMLTLSLPAAAQSPQPAHAQTPANCQPVGALKPGIDYDARLTLISITNACGQPVPLAVDIAATDARQSSGLMNLAPLPPYQGELFVFDNVANGNPVLISFWMKDTEIPLSIAFIGKDGVIQEIQDMQPESLDLHTPAQAYLYAIEANQGWFARHDIGVGARVDLAPALALAGANNS